MERLLDSWHSPSLDKTMEIAIYGTSGRPFLMFPSAAADYLEYERFYLIDSIAHYVEEGRLRVFSINSINAEAWLNHEIEPRQKALRHQQYNRYVETEVIPYIGNATDGGRPITCGVSLGALHAANVLFRRPELFDGVVGLSGIYDLKSYTAGYFDEDVYFNSPMDYLRNLEDEEILTQMRTDKEIHFLSGSGPYEDPSATRAIDELLTEKEIPHRIEIWSDEWSHDWPTWREMLPSYLERTLMATTSK